MNILLIGQDPGRIALLLNVINKYGYTVVALLNNCTSFAAKVEHYQADAIILDIDTPDRETLESIRQMGQGYPCPTIMFAKKSDRKTMASAIKAGVSAYVVDGIDTRPLDSIMDLAIARFREYQVLRNELNLMREKLADRKDIEKAKGLLMKQTSINENEAYIALRKFAMENNRSLGEVSRNLIKGLLKN